MKESICTAKRIHIPKPTNGILSLSTELIFLTSLTLSPTAQLWFETASRKQRNRRECIQLLYNFICLLFPFCCTYTIYICIHITPYIQFSTFSFSVCSYLQIPGKKTFLVRSSHVPFYGIVMCYTYHIYSFNIWCIWIYSWVFVLFDQFNNVRSLLYDFSFQIKNEFYDPHVTQLNGEICE